MKAIDQVIALEREALDGWASGKAEGYAIHAHPDLIYFDNLGAQELVEGMENVIAYAKKTFAELPAHTYEMAGLKARKYGDTVILSYQYHPSLLDGSPSTKWAATVVYSLTGSRWKMVHANWTMLIPPQMPT
ncbi:nuclear transport factor 2 family protein [Muriicola marianensis]|uniref:SnoaL-like domain-containing protein n=1 Tax=Muriicola marianensis TaxID=1324801 RepID=A0ABQ1R608_9FLAO|nr:nuclear transport factor 2 family protein [Muriicola marianensis]GGD57371.1 hypothetical protein GCM10011361_24870 [Muriicola marianensis]